MSKYLDIWPEFWVCTTDPSIVSRYIVVSSPCPFMSTFLSMTNVDKTLFVADWNSDGRQEDEAGS